MLFFLFRWSLLNHANIGKDPQDISYSLSVNIAPRYRTRMTRASCHIWGLNRDDSSAFRYHIGTMGWLYMVSISQRESLWVIITTDELETVYETWLMTHPSITWESYAENLSTSPELISKSCGLWGGRRGVPLGTLYILTCVSNTNDKTRPLPATQINLDLK